MRADRGAVSRSGGHRLGRRSRLHRDVRWWSTERTAPIELCLQRRRRRGPQQHQVARMGQAHSDGDRQNHARGELSTELLNSPGECLCGACARDANPALSQAANLHAPHRVLYRLPSRRRAEHKRAFSVLLDRVTGTKKRPRYRASAPLPYRPWMCAKIRGPGDDEVGRCGGPSECGRPAVASPVIRAHGIGDAEASYVLPT
jgi:hypothetical protein